MFKGYDSGYSGLIPPYIVMTELQGRFSEAGFLGQRYRPFATGGDPAKNPFAVEGVVAIIATQHVEAGVPPDFVVAARTAQYVIARAAAE